MVVRWQSTPSESSPLPPTSDFPHDFVIDTPPPSDPDLDPAVDPEPDPEPETHFDRRERLLAAARYHIYHNRYKSWQEQASELLGRTDSAPFAELIAEEELEDSMARVARSRSVDLSLLSREKYLSRWSRENTPVDSSERYERHLRRSYTPLREISSFQHVEDTRRPYSGRRSSTPLGIVTAPYHTNIAYRSENEPLRKYDVFQLRSWSYPIYKYIYRDDTHSTRPYSWTRTIAMTPKYTPPQMTPEARPLSTRRGYSGYAYLASENNFDITSRPRSLKNYNLWKPYLNVAPHFSKYYGNTALRHYNSYRPRPYFTRIPSYHAPYY